MSWLEQAAKRRIVDAIASGNPDGIIHVALSSGDEQDYDVLAATADATTYVVERSVAGYFWRPVNGGREIEVRADTRPPDDPEGWTFQEAPTGLLTIHLYDGVEWKPVEFEVEPEPPGPTEIRRTTWDDELGAWTYDESGNT